MAYTTHKLKKIDSATTPREKEKVETAVPFCCAQVSVLLRRSHSHVLTSMPFRDEFLSSGYFRLVLPVVFVALARG